MTDFNPVELIHAVGRIRATALLNRGRCETRFARDLHETLLQKLDQMVADLHEEMATEREFAANRDTPDGEECYRIYHICTRFEHLWMESGPISVLDEIDVDVEVDREICRARRDYALVPDAELKGLGEILDRIKQETGVEFVAARI
jgi:hypothetical protein